MVDFRPYIFVIHIWKAYASMVNFSDQETILVHPTRRHSLIGKSEPNFLQHLRPCHVQLKKAAQCQVLV